MKKFLLFVSLIPIAFAYAQPITIYAGATLHTGNGKVIENGYLVVNEGKIADVGSTLSDLYKNAKVVDASGKHIYPGVVALNNFAGLNEIDAVRATRDYSEVGVFNPNAQALYAFNTDSKILETFTFNGIAYTQAVPQGGLISGSSSIFTTNGHNWEGAVVAKNDGVHLNWPEIFPTHRNAEKRKNNIEERIAEIEQFFSDCNSYFLQDNLTEKNLKFEAMRGVFGSTQNLYVHVSGAKSMLVALNFFKQQYPQIKLVFVGAEEALPIVNELVKHKIPVILTNIHRLPKHNQSATDEPFKLAAQLVNAGVLTAIGHSGSWEARNLMFNAGTAAAYGLNKEQALACITSNAAKIAGVDTLLGSLTKGLSASFVICSGDLLDMKESVVETVVINGETADLNNHQKRLYEQYKKRYKLN